MEYPENVKSNPHILLQPFNYKLPNANVGKEQWTKQGSAGEDIYLYVPTNFGDAVGSSWAVEDVSLAAKEALTDGDNGDILSGAARDIAQGVMKKYAGGVSAVDKYKAMGQGKFLNPSNLLILDSVGRYSITFNWLLVPQNAGESATCLNIIKELRKHSQPTVISAGDRFNLKYPPVFNIDINTKGAGTSSISSADTKLFSYEAMILENFTVNYGGGANEALFYENGMSITANLTASFKSILPAINQQ